MSRWGTPDDPSPAAQRKLFEAMQKDGNAGFGQPPKPPKSGCPPTLIFMLLKAAAWVVRTWLR